MIRHSVRLNLLLRHFFKINGVVSYGKGTVTLSIITECNEKDYHYVQRALNHAVATAFREYDISIK